MSTQSDTLTALEGSTRAFHNLWSAWLSVARRHARVPLLLDPELNALARTPHGEISELQVLARAMDAPPALLLCGGDAELAMQVGQALGFALKLPAVTPMALIWSVRSGTAPELSILDGNLRRTIPAASAPRLLAQWKTKERILFLEERQPSDVEWQFCWMPHPDHFASLGMDDQELELLLTQRAAIMIKDQTPGPLRETLTSLGQKLWQINKQDLETPEEREQLLAEIGTVRNDRPEELDLRATAARNWLLFRLRHQVEEKKRNYQQILQQCESRTGTARQLLTQYRANWISGVRSLVELHLQGRSDANGFAPILDPQKPAIQSDAFLSALNLSALTSKLDTFVTDRMADFVIGLSGLAAKLDFQRVSLGEANARWSAQSLAPRLHRALNEKRVFESNESTRLGLAGVLMGRNRQKVMDERAGQISRASRIVLKTVEKEFGEWSNKLIQTVEAGVTRQIVTSLEERSLPDIEGIKQVIADLERLERILIHQHESAPPAEILALRWLHALAPS